jgi:TolA-binding protein
MVGYKMKYCKILVIFLVLSLISSGCVYYNTFYHAKKNFNDAEEQREKTGQDKAGGSSKKYKVAIEKSMAVLTDHPESKYVDDALYIIGKSFYHLGDYSRSERKFRELLAAYPESDFVERALFHLGKCRLQQEEFILARQTFIQVDSITNNKKWKAESQFMLGEIEFSEERYEEAIGYYSNYLEKYASAESAAKVQYKIAEAYALLENYKEANSAYLAVKDYNPEDSMYFNAQFNAGESYYQIGMIDSGFAVFEDLSTNEKFYKSAGEIRLKLSEALLMREDYEMALEEYSKITAEFEKTEPAAQAYYEMGEIYMRQFNDLETAKLMYDSAKTAYRRAEIYNVAVERSADISKLSQYRASVGGEDLDNAAQSQFQLAELYLFQLENPDTALAEFQNLIDTFPDSKFTALAYLAKGYIHSNFMNQEDSSKASYQKVLNEYSHTDQVEDAAQALGINLDTMDIDYPGKRYQEAENLLFEYDNIDSALVIFQAVIDDFPDSKYTPKAAYAKVWLMEEYSPPEEWNPDDTTFIPDSTVLLGYKSIVDLYANTEYADSALVKLGQKKVRKPRPKPQQEEIEEEDSLFSDEPRDADPERDTTIYSAFAADQIAELIDTLHLIDSKPTVQGEFIYPPSAYYSKFEGYVGFMLKIDFLGKPVEYYILQSSGNKDIDEAAIESMKYTEFSVGEIPMEYIDQWQFYKFTVRLPLEIQGRE